MANALLIGVMLVSASLKGGLVGALAFEQDKLDTRASLFTGPDPRSIARITNICPSPNADGKSIITTWDGSSYLCENTTNYQGGDLTGIIAYSLKDCADACSTHHKFQTGNGCAAFTLDADLARSYEINNGANCWLKGDTKGSNYDYNGASAKLCADTECETLVNTPA